MFKNIIRDMKLNHTVKTLSRYSDKYRKKDFNKFAIELLPNCKTIIQGFYWIYRYEYRFTIGNIEYSVRLSDKNIYEFQIKVDNINICKRDTYKNKDIWNHTLPKEMLLQIDEDLKIINKIISQIKYKCKHYREFDEKHIEEIKELERMFCKEDK